jgi:glycosyltransferase involved in cell wall biosynthesis
MQENFIKLTVVIPTYNRLSLLKKALPNYLKTKRKDVKFIILDNASKDGTSKYIRDQSKKDKRINFVIQKKNKYYNGNVLDGFSMIKSPYGMLLHDDDMIHGNYIEQVIDIFENFPSVAIVHNRTHRVNNIAYTKYKNDYDLYSSGFEAAKGIFMQGGSFPGLSYRMVHFDFKEYPKGRKYIYPLVKMNLTISKNYQVAILNKQGVVAQNLIVNTDQLLKQNKEQERDHSLGIDEYFNYTLDIFSKEEIIELSYLYRLWIFKIVKLLPEKNYNSFLKQISKRYASYCMIFLFQLINIRFKLIIIYYIIRNFFNPRLLIFNVLNLKFLTLKVIKKLF